MAGARATLLAIFLLGLFPWTNAAGAYAVPAECIPVMEATSDYLSDKHGDGSYRSPTREGRARTDWFNRVSTAYSGPKSQMKDVMWQVLRAHARRCDAWPWETEGTFWRKW